MREVRGRGIEIKSNWTDRLVGFFNPAGGLERMKARTLLALSGGYTGASKSRRQTSQWQTSSGDADTDILPDLPDLRERSRDLIRNSPIAAGAIHTKVSSVVGTGLRLQSMIDREFLGIEETQAEALQSEYEREWRLFSESPECDAARQLDFAAQQELAFRQTLENGDVFVLMPMIERPGSPYELKLQMIEADRVSNPGLTAQDTATLAGGITRDSFGAPVTCHVSRQHPGRWGVTTANKWDSVPFFGATTGRRNVIHLFRKLRPGQTRGVPDLATVIEPLKQLDRYTEAELMAAVVAGMFTVFIKTEAESGMTPMESTAEVGGATADKDYKMAAGAMLDLMPGESIETANPGRPNQSFDPFVQSILRQIGVALELPFEILIKHFTASYSAARAALLEAWKFYRGRRSWLARCLCNPVYAAWFEEAVLRGRISAPGFVNGDFAVRRAYLGAEWIGDSPGQINELLEVKAARERIDGGLSSLTREVPYLTGVDYETVNRQRAKERRMNPPEDDDGNDDSSV